MSRAARFAPFLCLALSALGFAAACTGVPVDGETFAPAVVEPARAAEPAEERMVGEWFQAELKRAPSAAERSFWSAELARRPQAQVRDYLRLVAETFAEVYHRAPTTAELARFTELLDRGVPL